MRRLLPLATSLSLALVAIWIALGLALPAAALSPRDLERQLGSKQGIAELVPSTMVVVGSVPDPPRIRAFLKAQQTLTILIDQAESQASIASPLTRCSAALAARPPGCLPAGGVLRLPCAPMGKQHVAPIKGRIAPAMAQRRF